ncbi:MAG: 50S ribosomal protein L29 [Candidatus Omnitrophica bacterium]|mgnify:CR=1 FL=1|nr:50S ribosomal protein L29 [Candidatus Omnitrophota bacterium]
MKTKEIRVLNKEELLDKLESLRKELYELNFQKKYSKLDKPHRFSLIRKDIARILTVIREKENETKA